MDSLETYWHQGFPEVEGWVDTRLLPFVRAVGDVQASAGITGEIAEIGVYHGKFLLALAHLAAPGTKITAIDVFEDQDKNIDHAGVGSLERLKQNIALFSPEGLDYAFRQADSIALTTSDKVDLVRTRGPFRLFSVDGCHTAEHTYTDLRTAEDALSPGGVLILDDYMNPHWPGVTEAVNMFYTRHVPRVKPFLSCCHKLFFVNYGWHAPFLAAMQERFATLPDARVPEMFASRVVTLYP